MKAQPIRNSVIQPETSTSSRLHRLIMMSSQYRERARDEMNPAWDCRPQVRAPKTGDPPHGATWVCLDKEQAKTTTMPLP